MMRRRRKGLLLALLVTAMLVAGTPAVPKASAAPAPIRVGVAYSNVACNAPGNNAYGLYRTRVNDVENVLRSEPGLGVTEIGDSELSNVASLKSYDVIVLTAMVATTEAERVAIRQYVAEGGGLVAMFSTSRYDGSNRYAPFNISWGFSASSYMSQSWEYGELSELFMTKFCNDPYFCAGYDVVGSSPAAHAILQATASDLSAKGLSTSISMHDAAAEFNETVWPIKGAPVTPLVSYANEVVKRYNNDRTGYRITAAPWGHASTMAGWAAPYYYGRVVNFGFQLYKLLSQPSAARLLVNSVKWAGSAKTYGAVFKAADVTGYAWYTSGQLWCNATLTDPGNIQLRGQFKADWFRPGASRAFYSTSVKAANVPVSPGEHYSDTAGKPSVGSSPARGCWIVRVSYRYYDYFRGGWVAVYRDLRLDSNGSSMTFRGAGPLVGPTTALPGPAGATQLAGSDRYGTAVAISRAGWPSGVGADSAVVLASGGNYTDALAAAPLAGKLHAPILLTPSSGTLPASVSGELTRLYQTSKPASATLYVVSSLPGGVVGAAGAAIAAAGVGQVDVVTLAGGDAYETARRIAARVGTPTSDAFADTAFIVTATNYADALSVAPVAASLHVPILFVGPNLIPASTQHALDELGITHCIILGSTSAVSGNVESWLENPAQGHRVSGEADNDTGPDTRLAGPTRYDTCLRIRDFAEAVSGFDLTSVYLATGTNYPDALALAPLAAQTGHPVVLVHGTDIGYSAAIAADLLARRSSPPSVTFAGSTAAVSSLVRGQVGVALRP